MAWRRIKQYTISLLLLLFPIVGECAPPTSSYTYVDGGTIKADEVQGNENNIYRYLQVGVDKYSAGSVDSDAIANATIVNADISASAAIVGSKLDLSSPGVIGSTSASAGTFTTMTCSTAAISGGSITGITDLVVADGGTGASTLTDGGILLGSGTDAITPMGVLANGTIVIGDGTTDPTTLAAFSSSTGTLATTYGGTGVATDDRIVSGWVNFQGSSTINDSYNVDSITDNGTGDYTITWTADFANDDYAVSICGTYTLTYPSVVGVIAAIATGTLDIETRYTPDVTPQDVNPTMVIAVGNR